MKKLVNRDVYEKLEFWAATALLAFALFLLVQGPPAGYEAGSGGGIINARYFIISNLVEYFTVYLAFLALNFRIIPRLAKREAMILNGFLFVALLIATWLSFGWVDTYLKSYITGAAIDNAAYNNRSEQSFEQAMHLMLCLGFYTAIKHFSLYLMDNTARIQTKYPSVTKGSLVAFIVWMVVMFLLLVAIGEPGLNAGWGIIVPYGILLHVGSFRRLIPRSVKTKRPLLSYLLRTILLLAISFFPVFLLAAIFVDAEVAASISLLNSIIQVVFTMPLSWVLYNRRLRAGEEITELKKELGKSAASLDSLRSQINPHFLFNALNTIYGMALQENAERTAEGVQKLGDMMRFMLQENMQEQISLAREIDYMQNYIALQRLRTDHNPAVRIDTDIEPPVSAYAIAPMLLIPFVENAFKHGISFRAPSYISVQLQVADKVLRLQVSNSVHEKSANDPEKEKSGIGLANVKQRLQLLYPFRHELSIRETKNDYLVDLSISLA